MASGIDNYRSGIRASIRGLWLAVFDFGQFYDAMDTAVTNNFTRAWREGAAECGVTPEDMTTEEKDALRNAIFLERGFIDGFAEHIMAHDKKNGGALEPLFSRGELWVLRYEAIRNLAQQMACKDEKLEWVLGMLKKEHCPSCIKVAGIVKRGSVWAKHDVRPQHPTKLLCMIGAGGVSVCGCSFRKTSLQCTPGPLPYLP